MSKQILVANKLPFGVHLDVKGRERVTLPGTALPHGIQREVPLPGGFLLTPVDEDHWKAWIGANAKLDPVKRGMIFAADTADAGRGRAMDNADLRTGFEPMDPKAMPSGLSILTA